MFLREAQLHANARYDYLNFAAGKLKSRRMRKVIESVSLQQPSPSLTQRALEVLCSLLDNLSLEMGLKGSLKYSLLKCLLSVAVNVKTQLKDWSLSK